MRIKTATRFCGLIVLLICSSVTSDAGCGGLPAPAEKEDRPKKQRLTIPITVTNTDASARQSGKNENTGRSRRGIVNSTNYSVYEDESCAYSSVKPGRDWGYGDNYSDKFTLGKVVGVVYVDGVLSNGWCWVVWESNPGWMHAYEVGNKGRYDLFIVQDEYRAYDNAACLYTRVKRGRDWTSGGYGDQYYGVGNLGTIVGVVPGVNESCFVIWDGNPGFYYSYPVSVGVVSYLCRVDANDMDVHSFVDGFDMDAFLESILYFTYPEPDIATRNITVTVHANQALLLKVATLSTLLIFLTTLYTAL